MGLAYTEKCGKCQEVGFTHFISGNICESDGMHDKQQLCSYRTLKTWKEFHHTVTSWNHSIMASRSRRHRSMSWSSSHLSASSMELPIWRPSMSITTVNTKIDSKNVNELFFPHSRQSLMLLEVQTPPYAPTTPPPLAQYPHRGNLTYQFSTELLQLPILLLNINDIESQVLS